MRAAILLVAALSTTAASAGEEPGSFWWTRQAVGAAGWPSGLISDTRLQWRTPLKRSDSPLFRTTYAGAGARLAVAPAFTDVGPRFSIAPIEIFDLDVQAGWMFVWPSSSGLLPYTGLEKTGDKLEPVRGDRHRDPATRAKTGNWFYLQVTPTLKAKVGPIIALDSWDFVWSKMLPHSTEGGPVFYEAYRDILVAREELVIVHNAAVFWEILDGKQGSLLWVGAQFRDRRSVRAGDRSIALGGIVTFKPDWGGAWPQFYLQWLPYLKDHSRKGRAPNLGFLAEWKWERHR